MSLVWTERQGSIKCKGDTLMAAMRSRTEAKALELLRPLAIAQRATFESMRVAKRSSVVREARDLRSR